MTVQLTEYLLRNASELVVTEHSLTHVSYEWKGESDWVGIGRDLVEMAQFDINPWDHLGKQIQIGPFWLMVFYYDIRRSVYFAQWINRYSLEPRRFNDQQNAST